MDNDYDSYTSSRTFESSFFETLPRFDESENTINSNITTVKYASDAYLEMALESRRKLVREEKPKSKKDKKKHKERKEERARTEQFLTYLNSSLFFDKSDSQDFDEGMNKENEIPLTYERNLSIKNDFKQPVILCKGCQNLLAYKSNFFSLKLLILF